MADELEMVTQSAGGSTWVDQSPGAVSTGYQAQNTSAEAARLGIDRSYVSVDNDNIKVEISGPIDDNGVLVSVKSEVTLTPSQPGSYVIKLVAGSESNKRSLELIEHSEAEYSSSRGCYITNSGERVLDWMIIRGPFANRVYRMPASMLPRNIGSIEQNSFPNGCVRYQDILPQLYRDRDLRRYVGYTSLNIPLRGSLGPNHNPRAPMTFLTDDQTVEFLLPVVVNNRGETTSWGKTQMDITSGDKVESNDTTGLQIRSMYLHGDNLIVLLDTGMVRVYSGRELSGSYSSFQLSSDRIAIDVLDGDLITATSTHLYRHNGISSGETEITISGLNDERINGVTHIGDRIIIETRELTTTHHLQLVFDKIQLVGKNNGKLHPIFTSTTYARSVNAARGDIRASGLQIVSISGISGRFYNTCAKTISVDVVDHPIP